MADDDKRGPGRPAGPAHRTRSLRFPETFWARVERAAKDAGTTVTGLIRDLLERHLASPRTSRGTSQKMKPTAREPENKR